MRTVKTDVYVASGQKGLLQDRMKVCTMLWDAGIRAEMSHKANPKLLTQFQYCEDELVPLQVVIGEEEKSKGSVKLRNTKTKEEVCCHVACTVSQLCQLLISNYTLVHPARLMSKPPDLFC